MSSIETNEHRNGERHSEIERRLQSRVGFGLATALNGGIHFAPNLNVVVASPIAFQEVQGEGTGYGENRGCEGIARARTPHRFVAERHHRCRSRSGKGWFSVRHWPADFASDRRVPTGGPEGDPGGVGQYHTGMEVLSRIEGGRAGTMEPPAPPKRL